MSRENREQTSARTANRSISSLRIWSSCGDRASAAVPRGGGELIDPPQGSTIQSDHAHTRTHFASGCASRHYDPLLGPPLQHDSQGRSHRRLCESAGDAESVVEDERMVPRVMPGPAHLHDPKLTLHPELALPREPEVEDSVDEVILFVLCICRPAWIAPSGSVRRKLSQQEGRAVQIPEPSDQGEQFPPRLAELREDLERVERIEDEETVVERFPDPASKDLVEPFDVRRDTLHCSPSTISSSRSRIESICLWIRAFSCGMSTIAARLSRSMLARSAIWTRSDRSRSSGFLPR